MFNPLHLTASRHGVYYLRFPIPAQFHPEGQRSSLRISLGTRCPKEALHLSRGLCYVGEQVMAIAEVASKVWIEHGALDYKECVLDDDNLHIMRSFHDAADLKEGETAVFAYIVYNSREERDAINAKVMTDPRIADHCHDMPFDVKRMAYAGFRGVVEAKKA